MSIRRISATMLHFEGGISIHFALLYPKFQVSPPAERNLFKFLSPMMVIVMKSSYPDEEDDISGTKLLILPTSLRLKSDIVLQIQDVNTRETQVDLPLLNIQLAKSKDYW